MIRRPIIALLLVVLGSTFAFRALDERREESPNTKFGFNELSVTTDDGVRPYLLYIPKSYTGEQAMPLVFFLHGGGGDMNQAKNYRLQEKAEMAGFLLVLANGASAFPGGRLATWNAGECCGYARDTASDDVGYIRSIVSDLTKSLVIDETRIYATGMSNGGMMSYRLACEASDIFAAVAPVAGTDSTITCTPEESVSILHIHAYDDTHVLYTGGAGEDAFRDESKVADFLSVPETTNRWVQRYELNETPTRTISVSGAFCDSYTRPGSETEFMLCVTETGEHSWPGSTVGTLLRDKQPSQAINANDVIWDFFTRHSK